MNGLPQRVALASFKDRNGQDVLVYVTREWLGLFDQLVRSVGGTPSGEAADDLGPPPLMGRHQTQRLESDNETGFAATAARIPGLLSRVQALEEASGLQQLRAEVAALRREVEALKEAPP